MFFGDWARDQHIALYDIAAFRFVGENDVQLDTLYDFHTVHEGALMTRPVSFHMRCFIMQKITNYVEIFFKMTHNNIISKPGITSCAVYRVFLRILCFVRFGYQAGNRETNTAITEATYHELKRRLESPALQQLPSVVAADWLGRPCPVWPYVHFCCSHQLLFCLVARPDKFSKFILYCRTDFQ